MSPRSPGTRCNAPSIRIHRVHRGFLSQFHFDLMILSIVTKFDESVWLFHTIDREAFYGTAGFGLQNSDVKDGFSVTVVEFERLPISGETRSEDQFVDLQMQS